MLDATGPRRYRTSTLQKTSTLLNLDTAWTLQNLVLILHVLLNFNTLPIYRKRSKRFAKIPKGAPTYAMHGAQTKCSRRGPWVDDMRVAVSYPPAKFAMEIHLGSLLIDRGGSQVTPACLVSPPGVWSDRSPLADISG